MLIYLLSFLIIAVLAALATAVIATTFLALGSALARVFAVSVWQATVVVMAAAAGLAWFLTRAAPGEDATVGDRDEDLPPIVVMPDLPLPRSRGRNRGRANRERPED